MKMGWYSMKTIGMALLFLLSGTAFASSANFNISGEISDMTCEIKTSHKNLVVMLPAVAKSDLDARGKTAGRTRFQILVENCAGATAAHNDKLLYAFFTSEHLDTTTGGVGTLKNAANRNRANNVNIQLTNEDGAVIHLANDKSDTASIASYQSGDHFNVGKREYMLNYAAQYYATGVATPGQVESYAVFTVAYK